MLNGTQLGGQNIRLSWGHSTSNKQSQRDTSWWNDGYYGQPESASSVSCRWQCKWEHSWDEASSSSKLLTWRSSLTFSFGPVLLPWLAPNQVSAIPPAKHSSQKPATSQTCMRRFSQVVTHAQIAVAPSHLSLHARQLLLSSWPTANGHMPLEFPWSCHVTAHASLFVHVSSGHHTAPTPVKIDPCTLVKLPHSTFFSWALCGHPFQHKIRMKIRSLTLWKKPTDTSLVWAKKKGDLIAFKRQRLIRCQGLGFFGLGGKKKKKKRGFRLEREKEEGGQKL